MTTLVAGTLFRSRDPTLLVENKLEPGAWIFRLVVVDNDGNESAPADLTVAVGRVAVSPPPPPPLTRDPRLEVGTTVGATLDPRAVSPPPPPPVTRDPRLVVGTTVGTTLNPRTVSPSPPPPPPPPLRPIDPRVIIRRPPG